MPVTLSSPARPERVFEYLSIPRNLLTGNHPGPVESQSDTIGGVGSWAVLAFDNLRVRVEYTAWDRPSRIAATFAWSGRGSGGRREASDYALAPSPDGGTLITIEAATQSGVASIPIVSRIVRSLVMRRWRSKFAAIKDAP